MSQDKQELLEIYKLHAELADRVSQRREGVHRLYVSLITGVFIFPAAFIRFGHETDLLATVLFFTGCLGCVLSISWCFVVRSYRKLNETKFIALHELEEELAYPFFKREWESRGKGKNKGYYLELTTVETSLPIIFLFLSVCLIIFSVCM